MEVRSGSEAGSTDRRDLVASDDPLASLDVQRRRVCVERGDTVSVVDDYRVAVAVDPARGYDDA